MLQVAKKKRQDPKASAANAALNFYAQVSPRWQDLTDLPQRFRLSQAVILKP
jgi:hypothetical protein